MNELIIIVISHIVHSFTISDARDDTSNVCGSARFNFLFGFIRKRRARARIDFSQRKFHPLRRHVRSTERRKRGKRFRHIFVCVHQ